MLYKLGWAAVKTPPSSILCKNSTTAIHESNFTRAYHTEISWATLIPGAHARLRLTKHEGLKCSQETCQRGWLKQGGWEQYQSDYTVNLKFDEIGLSGKRRMMMKKCKCTLDCSSATDASWLMVQPVDVSSSYPLIDSSTCWQLIHWFNWFNIKLSMRMKIAIDEDCPPILSGVEPTRAFWSWTHQTFLEFNRPELICSPPPLQS